MTNQSSCPSEFTLERWRFGELAASAAEAPLLAHIEACPDCRRRQAELAAADQPGLDTAAIWASAAGARDARPKTRWRFLTLQWAGAAFAGAAIATTLGVLVQAMAPGLRLPSPESEALTKGGPFQLGVIAKRRDGSILRLDPGAQVAPGDDLRFEVFTSWTKADIAMVMLDSAGRVSQIAPARRQSIALASGRKVLLDETVELDGSLGIERIILVACRHSLDVADVVSSARRALLAAHGDPRQVDGLGTGCHEESFWITKVSK
jgi:hypothetical protein